MSSSSSSSYRRYNQDVSNKTHYDCKPPHPIPIQTAWTTDNPGRRFRGFLIRDKSKKCGVYGFLNLELPSDYYKVNEGEKVTGEGEQDFGGKFRLKLYRCKDFEDLAEIVLEVVLSYYVHSPFWD
ncbi:hypothetical protein Tco_1035693 [Tanacetum coccineum]